MCNGNHFLINNGTINDFLATKGVSNMKKAVLFLMYKFENDTLPEKCL